MSCIQEPGVRSESIDWWSLSYVSNDEQLTCPICLTVLVDPYCTDCGHVFCHDCLNASCKTTSTDSIPAVCPIDRKPLESCPRAAPFVVKHMIDELITKCPFSSRGCLFEGKRWLLESHVESECQYVKVFCHGNCTNQIERRFYEEGGCHCNDNNVSSESIENEETQGGVSEHSEEIFKCSGQSIGCDFECTDNNLLEEHCSKCSMSKIFEVIDKQQERISSIEKENRSLKHQLDTLHRLAKKGSTMLDAEILAEYDRIIHEVRQTQSSQTEQQAVISSLVTEASRLNTDLSHIAGILDSLRRQMFHFTQSQLRMSLHNSVQSHDSTNANYEDNESVKHRSKQKL